MTKERRQQVREILESVLRAVHRHATSDKPMSIKDCSRAFRLVERTISLERTLVTEAKADEFSMVGARGRRDDPVTQPSSTVVAEPARPKA